MKAVESNIDWFSINLEEFELALQECKDALEECNRVEREIESCLAGECSHPRKLKKDGKPDKRSDCPEAFKLYLKSVRLENALCFKYNLGFFQRIGLL